MIAVIFEVEPQEALRQQYLDIAAALGAQLEEVDGFISIERFASLTRPGCILSLSIWRDEQSVQRWRGAEAHRAAQARGRSGLFRHYRLRVAQIVRTYTLDQREQAPTDSRQAHG